MKLEKENEQLRQENIRLKKEVELEGRVREHWKTIAEMFHDSLWETLIKYEPETYGKWHQRQGQQCSKEEETEDIDVLSKVSTKSDLTKGCT